MKLFKEGEDFAGQNKIVKLSYEVNKNMKKQS